MPVIPDSSSKSGKRTAAAGSLAGTSSRLTTRMNSAIPGSCAGSLVRSVAARVMNSMSAAASVRRQSMVASRSAASSGPAIGSNEPVAVALRYAADNRE